MTAVGALSTLTRASSLAAQTTPQFGSPDLVAARARVEKLAREKAGAQGFDRAYADGLAMDLAAGVDYALGEPSPPPHETHAQLAGWAPLTRREREVAALVAEGLTNQQIAERTFLSPKTVEVNLTRIYRKLGVRRAALANRLAEIPKADQP